MMKARNSIRLAACLVALLTPFMPAHAQLGNLLQSATSGSVGASANASAGGGSGLGGALGSAAGALSGGGGQSGSGSALSGATSMLGGGGGGLGGASSMLSGSSSSNVAGLLTYCIKNNYLGGASGATSVQSSLMGKLGGNTSDSGYQSGASGMLQGGGGASMDLGGSLKAAATKQMCNQVLAQAKGML
jgi:hypothetical protein